MTLRRVLTVFLADDDLDDHDFFKMALERVDPSIRCTTARDGEEALSKLTQNTGQPPDVIFLDVSMPRLNGMECLSEIKKNKELSHIPIIMYSSSFLIEKEVKRGKNRGAMHFFEKPTTLTDLEQFLRSVLKQ